MTLISYETTTLIDEIVALEESQFYEHADIKAQKYLEIALQLETDGFEKRKISAKIVTLVTAKMQEKSTVIIPKWHNGYFKKVMAENEYSDPEYRKPVDPLKDLENTSDIDPAQDLENTSDDDSKQKASPKQKPHPNADILNLYSRIIEFCELGMVKAFDAQKPIFGTDLKGKKEFILQSSSIIDNCTAALNEKTKVPANTELVLLTMLASEAGVNLAAKAFLKYRLTFFETINKFLTRKQALKFLKNDVPVLPIFQPHDQYEALYMDYVGNQCSKCKSWCLRVSPDDQHLAICQGCDAETKIKAILRCRSCRSLIDPASNKCLNTDCGMKIKASKIVAR